jgi:hypothetical protein
MIKSLFLFVLYSIVFDTAFAQKRDTTVYYLNTAGRVVSTTDSADFFLVVLPPDTDVNKNLFIVKEFYKNGNLRLASSSSVRSYPLIYQGAYIAFFPNGKKMKVENFENGTPMVTRLNIIPMESYITRKLLRRSKYYTMSAGSQQEKY